MRSSASFSLNSGVHSFGTMDQSIGRTPPMFLAKAKDSLESRKSLGLSVLSKATLPVASTRQTKAPPHALICSCKAYSKPRACFPSFASKVFGAMVSPLGTNVARESKKLSRALSRSCARTDGIRQQTLKASVSHFMASPSESDSVGQRLLPSPA